MKDIKVSVAIATYNGEKYLREQLDSLYNQTLVPDEVVVVDDCSTDGTQSILEEYHQKKGLCYFVNSKNLGVNKNFEKAIKNCTGDYIAICDQDDFWLPHKIETSLKKLKEIECGAPACVSSKCIGVNKDLIIIDKHISQKEDTVGLKASLLENGVAQGCSLMFNRELLNKLIPTPDGFMYDALIGYTAACIGKKYNIGEPLMLYRHHESNVIGKARSGVKILPRIINHLRMWKYSTLFEYVEFDYLRLMLKYYTDDINIDYKEYLNKLIAYDEGNVFEKMMFVCNENYYSFGRKTKYILRLLVTFWMPLKNI